MELLVGVAVLGLLASIAYPSYQAVVLRSRRFDAQTALLQLQGIEERYRSTNAQYGDLTQLQAAAASPSGFYVLEVRSPSATSYQLLASARGNQQWDAVCRHLAIVVDGESVVFASGSGPEATNGTVDNKRCWGV